MIVVSQCVCVCVCVCGFVFFLFVVLSFCFVCVFGGVMIFDVGSCL